MTIVLLSLQDLFLCFYVIVFQKLRGQQMCVCHLKLPAAYISHSVKGYLCYCFLTVFSRNRQNLLRLSRRHDNLKKFFLFLLFPDTVRKCLETAKTGKHSWDFHGALDWEGFCPGIVGLDATKQAGSRVKRRERYNGGSWWRLLSTPHPWCSHICLGFRILVRNSQMSEILQW